MQCLLSTPSANLYPPNQPLYALRRYPTPCLLSMPSSQPHALRRCLTHASETLGKTGGPPKVWTIEAEELPRDLLWGDPDKTSAELLRVCVKTAAKGEEGKCADG